MAALLAILEDDEARSAEMRDCLADLLPGAQVVFFDASDAMIQWLRKHLADVVLISLDHDLPLRERDGTLVDCGTGRHVVDFLASLGPTCPVIVHSSNDSCAAGMVFALREAGWPQCRVHPADDLAWVRLDWAERVRRYIQEGWIPQT